MSICFQKEWTRPDGSLLAIPHVNTKNDSFLRHCQVLKKMGISNYAFPLALYNPILKNVDVHALEEDTPENEQLRTAVMIEARHNVWYFFRECVRIYSQGGKPVSFRLDRGSCAMTWSFLNGIDYAGMQPRQTGKEQPLRSKLLSEGGWVAMGEVYEGMRLIAPDGSLSTVIGVFPQGIRDTYKITLDDGRSAECGIEHLWKVYFHPTDPHFKILELKDFISLEQDIYLPVVTDHFDEFRVRVKSVEYVDSVEHQCISVDHPDQLYITDDMIVTHNTVCALSLCAWVMYASGEDYTIGHFAKDNDLRQENVKRVKSIGEFLPPWWMSENKFKDKKNSEEIYYSALKTHYRTMVAQSDKRQADLKARGASFPMIHIDEVEFCANIDISYPTMLASTGTARENARMNGKPYSNILTTTAGDPTKSECREAAKILSGAMPFSEYLYDLDSKEQLHEVVKANSPQMMLIGVFSHLQLGYDNEWLRDKITRNSMTREQTMRDYLNRRVSIQETPVIPKETLALITSSEMEHKHLQILNGRFAIFWYLDKEVVQSQSFKQRPIVVGCDSSEMIGRDATTLVGIDPRDLSVVFTFRANEGNLNTVGAIIAQLLIEYPAMIFVPENKSSGTGFIDTVSLLLRKENHNPFKRMFNWIVNNKQEEEFSKYDIRDMSLLDTVAKKYFGIKTDKNKREQLYSSTLLTATKMAPTRIRDKTLISELQALVVKNGRVDHEAGSHDDSCFIGSTMVRTDTGNRPISELKVGDLVLTREGYKPILSIFTREKEVITKYGLTGTANHPFITPNGLEPFESLTDKSEVYIWNEKRSCIEVKNITDIPNLIDHNIENTSTDTIKPTSLLSLYIDRYTKTITDLFRKVMKSTIKTTIIPTMTMETSSVLLPKIIEQSIPSLKKQFGIMESEQRNKISSEYGAEKIQNSPENTLLETVNSAQVSQTGEKITLSVTENSAQKMGKKLSKSTELEVPWGLDSLLGGLKIQNWLQNWLRKMERKDRIAEKRSPVRIKTPEKVSTTGAETILKRLVAAPLKPVRKAEKPGEQTKQLVYNLHVSECHEYFVNDVLVHNCIAYLMAMWFILSAKNLDVYGIKPGTIFSLAPTTKDKDEQLEALRQDKIQNRIDELTQARRRQNDPALRMLIDKDLGLLESLQEKHAVPTTVTADELQRNPKRFIDQDIAASNRTKVTQEEVTSSIRAMFTMGQ